MPTHADAIIDEARDIRAGEEFDHATLERYLRAALPGVTGPLSVAQFRRGHSNLTYLLRVGDRELVLRRPPIGAAIRTAHDMGREYRILSALQGVYPRAPRPFAYCEDPDVLGAPFYVMERVKGVILRGSQLPRGVRLDPATMRRLCEALVDNLAALHAVDVTAGGLAEIGRPDGYVERQVRGWTQRYAASRTDDVPEFDAAAAWLAENMPTGTATGALAHGGVALVHNDYKYDNLVLDPDDLTTILAVLDWEMATVADPLMDLGTSLGYWVDPEDPDEVKIIAQGPTLTPGNLSRREVVERYAQASGRDVSGIVFYFVYGLFKIAVIAQQIYKRFREGHTKDPRFAGLLFAVQVVSRAAVRAIERGRIHDLA